MKRLTFGERLPSPFFEYTQDPLIAAAGIRTCKTCGYKWPTVEIPIGRDWTWSALVCQQHQDQRPGIVLKGIRPPQAYRGWYDSLGLRTVIAIGGVWRRRKCRVPGCTLKNGKPGRWTTAEVDSRGLVVEDVSKCARCGGERSVRALRSSPQ